MENLIKKPKRPWRNEYNSVHAAVMFLASIIGVLAIPVAVVLILDLIDYVTGSNITGNLTTWLLLNISLQLIFGGVALVVTRIFRVRFGQASYVKRCSSTTVLIAVILTAVCYLATFPLLGATMTIFELIGYGSSGLPIDEITLTWYHLVLFGLNLIVFAGVCEELVFRGGAMWGIKNDFGKAAAILLSGIAFSIMHMNPMQTVHQFVLGCVMGYITIELKSMIPAIIIHALNNAFAFGMLLFISFVDFIDPGLRISSVVANAPLTNAQLTNNLIIFLGMSLVSIPVGGLLVWVLVKAGKDADKIKAKAKADKTAAMIIAGGTAEVQPIPVTAPAIPPTFVNIEEKRKKTQRKIIFGIIFSIAVAICLLMWGISFLEGMGILRVG